MPSNATVATRWTMLPLLDVRVAETLARTIREQKTLAGLVLEHLRRWGSPGPGGMSMPLRSFGVGLRMPRWLGGDGSIRARNACGPADLDRAGNRRPAE